MSSPGGADPRDVELAWRRWAEHRYSEQVSDRELFMDALQHATEVGLVAPTPALRAVERRVQNII